MQLNSIVNRFNKAINGLDLDDQEQADISLFNEFAEFASVPSNQTSLPFGSLSNASTFSDYLSGCVGLSGDKLKSAINDAILSYFSDLKLQINNYRNYFATVDAEFLI